ncbi:MAG TPA: hypothetical protein V6D11_28685 [Waterburya sp.]
MPTPTENADAPNVATASLSRTALCLAPTTNINADLLSWYQLGSIHNSQRKSIVASKQNPSMMLG